MRRIPAISARYSSAMSMPGSACRSSSPDSTHGTRRRVSCSCTGEHMSTEMRVVGAGRGWQWLVDGYALFRRSPANWMALTLIFGLLWLSSLFIPLVGPLLFNLFSPLLFAGLMIGCRALEEGKPLEVSTLFAAFKQHSGPLVTVGGVYLVGTIVVLGIVLIIAGGSLLPTLMKSGADIETIRAAVRSLAIALAVGAIIYLPLIMLIWTS